MTSNISCPSCEADNAANARYCSACGLQMPLPTNEIEQSPPPPIKNTAGKKKQIIGVLLGACAFWLTTWGVQKMFFSTPSFDKMLVAAANEINKACPMMVDQSTQLDNAVALPGNAFQYNYTVLDVEKSEVNMDTVKKYIGASIINNVRNSPELKPQRDHKTTLIYSYKDKNGVSFYKLSVTPDMYQ